jgi:hypothetical protein
MFFVYLKAAKFRLVFFQRKQNRLVLFSETVDFILGFGEFIVNFHKLGFRIFQFNFFFFEIHLQIVQLEAPLSAIVLISLFHFIVLLSQSIEVPLQLSYFFLKHFYLMFTVLSLLSKGSDSLLSDTYLPFQLLNHFVLLDGFFLSSSVVLV